MTILSFEEFLDEAAYNPYGEYGYNIHDYKGIAKFKEKQRKTLEKMKKGAPVDKKPSEKKPSEEGPDSPEEREARRKRYAAAGLKF